MDRRAFVTVPRLTAGAGLTRRMPLVLLALALSACVTSVPQGSGAPQGAAQVSRVILYPDTVTVEMRDRSLCTGPRTRPGPGWSGTLAGCRHLWPYEVTQPPQRIVRLPLRPGAGGAGQVALTPPGGAAQIWSGAPLSQSS